jgi:4-hydroxybenzoate polyprenyltransferase
VLLGGAVLCWTAGFDILYACQDVSSDRETGVFSVPARMGVARGLWVARFTHLLSAALLLGAGFSTSLLGPLYFGAVGVAIVLLIIEHAIVRADDLAKLGLAFFTVNGVISLLVGTMGIADAVMRGGR